MQFSIELDVVNLRENNPWIGGRTVKQWTTFPSDSKQEWVL